MSQVKTFVQVTEQKPNTYSESELSQDQCGNTKAKAMGREQALMRQTSELLNFAFICINKRKKNA